MINLPDVRERLTDAELISRVLSGETDLYEIIVRRYNAYLYKTGRSYGYEHADVEDLMQETYVNAYLHLKDFEHRASFKTWLVRIMLNQCYHKKQKFSYQKETAVRPAIEEKSTPMFNDPRTDTGSLVLNRELGKMLEDAIHRIPEAYRMVFTLRELNGMSVNETSEVMEISPANVKVRLNRARHMLQQELQKVYSAEDIFEFNLIYCDAMADRVMSAVRSLAGVALRT